ncbi:tripartite tricarboxylate transporter substrate binding protein [Acidovorax sp. SUPP950]|uniref:Bug family tripartite tricarboxylate transporter substrate binding protein n=1 Tax=Acidovorax sp. SUPP950 TaxID=511901 RepID=UPI0023D712B9|nr:tripartite tricarboxylate transporter substrate-binding protein [Acidovorax sp. SUPP950]GKS77387.1 tripartite tricarboxylate transporter substrate binding protein [Acidovorax sp. SUPP950]
MLNLQSMLWKNSLLAAMLGAVAGAVGITAIPRPAFAQDAYPSKPVKLIVPFGAGGITDVVARLVGQKLGEELRQPVVIENRAGAGGNIAAQALAQAAPDGYTLLLGTVGTQVVNKMIYNKLTYDSATFTPISLVSNSPYVLAVGDIPGVTDLKGLVAYAKANPDRLNAGSAGNASSPHLGLELFKIATGTAIVHVPFKSGAEAINAALSNQVQIVIDAIPVVKSHVQTGKLKALAIASEARSPALPNVATSSQAGVPTFQIGSWNALLAPPGTPKQQASIVAGALSRALARPDMQNRLAEMGIEALPTGEAAYQKHVRSETEKWTRIVRVAGTKVD